MSRYLIYFIIAISFISCKEQRTYFRTKKKVVTNDSLYFNVNYTVHRIKVGKNINNLPLSSQIIKKNDRQIYYLLDNNKLYGFDWTTGVITDSIVFQKHRNLTGFSGFNIISDSLIILYDDFFKRVYQYDFTGKEIAEWKVPSNKDKTTKWVWGIEALNQSRPQKLDNKIFLGGNVWSNLKQANSTINVIEWLDIKSGEWNPILGYSSQYLDYNWGGGVMNCISMVSDSTKLYVSFPLESNIYTYDPRTGDSYTIDIGSRYDSGIEESQLSFDECNYNSFEVMRYFASQSTYGQLLYDDSSNLFYRIFESPIEYKKPNTPLFKPFSIITFDTEGIILSETPLINTDGKTRFINTNIHVIDEGIAIALENKQDEDNIYFAIFNKTNL